MKVFLLTDINTTHSHKWIVGLRDNGVEVLVFSLTSIKDHSILNNINVKVFSLNLSPQKSHQYELAYKFRYLFAIRLIRKIIREEKPDIVHAHYATSYGFLSVLATRGQNILSVWGSDVLEFPKKNFLRKLFLRFVLNNSKKILATSSYLSKETEKLCSKKVSITPFGVDVGLFNTPNREYKTNDSNLVIGSIKTIDSKYNSELLVRAFNEIVKRNQGRKLRLLLAGNYSYEEYYNKIVKLINEFGIQQYVELPGRIPNEKVPDVLSNIDIFVNISVFESFGVSVLEASSCGIPIVASDVGGLKEVVKHNVSGLLVPVNDLSSTITAIDSLVQNAEMRMKFGQAGRNFVVEKYCIEKCINVMLNEYNNYILTI